MRLSVVGASGRVGSALVDGLSDRYDIVPIARVGDEPQDSLAARAVDDVKALVNAAGVAHLGRVTDADLERLRAANVQLPSALAAAAVEQGVSMVHISSVKATAGGDTAYAQSKRDGDEILQREWAREFEQRGISLVIVRPLAMLFPPLTTGKVAKLRFVTRIPEALTPSIPLPVLGPVMFIDAIADELAHVADGRTPPGLSWRNFRRSDWGTLRDVRRAMRVHERISP